MTMLADRDRMLLDMMRENARLRGALAEARLQIEYLHEKFQPTGSGASVLATIDAALTNQ